MKKTQINLEFETEILEKLLPGSSDTLFVGSMVYPISVEYLDNT